MVAYERIVEQLELDRRELARSLPGVVRLAMWQVLLPAIVSWCLYGVLVALEFPLLAVVLLGIGLTFAAFGFIADLVTTLQRFLYHAVIQTKIADFRLQGDFSVSRDA